MFNFSLTHICVKFFCNQHALFKWCSPKWAAVTWDEGVWWQGGSDEHSGRRWSKLIHQNKERKYYNFSVWFPVLKLEKYVSLTASRLSWLPPEGGGATLSRILVGSLLAYLLDSHFESGSLKEFVDYSISNDRVLGKGNNRILCKEIVSHQNNFLYHKGIHH